MHRHLTRSQTRTIGTIAVVVVVLGALLGGLTLADADTTSDTGTASGGGVHPDRPAALESHVPAGEPAVPDDDSDDTTDDDGGAAAPGTSSTTSPEAPSTTRPGRDVDPPGEARDGLTGTGGPDAPAGDADGETEGGDGGGEPGGDTDPGDPGDGGDSPPMTAPEGTFDDDGVPGADPMPPISRPSADCDAPHKQGSWAEYATGTSGDVVGFEPFVTAGCEGVTVDLAGEVPRLFVDRHPTMDRTIVELETSEVPAGPVHDHLDFTRFPGQWTTHAFVVHEDGALSVVLYHPEEADDLGLHVDIEGNRMVISVRERVPSDPEPYESYDDYTRSERPRGPFDEGLVLDAAADLGSGELLVSGYAKAPEDRLEVRVTDTDSGRLLCEAAVTVASPSHLYGRYETVCGGLPPGTHELTVRWSSSDGDTWHSEFVTVST